MTIKIRRHSALRLFRLSTVLLQNVLIKIEYFFYPPDNPYKKNGLVLLIRVGNSICLIWASNHRMPMFLIRENNNHVINPRLFFKVDADVNWTIIEGLNDNH